MANKTIADLTATTTLNDGDLFEIENTGNNSRKITAANMRAYAGGLISEVITSGSQASVTFSSISANFRDLIVVVRGRGTTSASNVLVQLQFNGDTGSNYHDHDAHWFGTATSFAQATARASARVGYLPAATATASYAGVLEVTVGDYRGTTFFKPVTGRNGASFGTAANSIGGGVFSGQWNSTSAITSVLVSLTAGNFVDGSVVSLYGRT